MKRRVYQDKKKTKIDAIKQEFLMWVQESSMMSHVMSSYEFLDFVVLYNDDKKINIRVLFGRVVDDVWSS